MDEEKRIISFNSSNIGIYPLSIQTYIKQIIIQKFNETNLVVEGNNYNFFDTYDPKELYFKLNYRVIGIPEGDGEFYLSSSSILTPSI
jgi:hypothetical protein